MVNEKYIFLISILYHNFWFWTVQQLYLQLLYCVQNQKLWYSEKIESCADFSGTSGKIHIFAKNKSLIWLWIWHLFQWLILLYLMKNITHAWIFFLWYFIYQKYQHLNFVEKIWKSVLFQLYFWIYIFYYIYCI